MLEKLLFLSILLQYCSRVNGELIKCSHDTADQPQPIRLPPRPEIRSKGPKFHFARDDEFVSYKVLFLIDETIPEPDYSKFKMATEYVNERLSKFLKAKRLMDVRLAIYEQTECYTCPNAKLPTEYMTPKCFSIDNPMKPNEGASEEIIERSKQNYTLAVRVLSNKDGIGTGQYDDKCTGGLATASECPFWPHLGGPTHGSFIYCKKYAELRRGDIQLLTTTLHETLHIVLPELTGDKEPSHRCEDLEACKGKTWKEVTRSTTNERGEKKTVTSFLAISEPIRDAARAHFNCPTAEGLELDYTRKADGDIDFTAHWSMHLFPDEILAPFDAPSQKLSNLTMSALAAQRSWYRVDFSYAEELVISKPSAEMGCAVYEKTCHEFLNEQREKGGEYRHRIAPYCDMSEAVSERIQHRCSRDHKIQVNCWKDDMTNCTHIVSDTGNYNSDVCDGATLTQRTASSVPFVMGSPEGSLCITLTEVAGFAQRPTHPLCVRHECDIHARILSIQFKPKQLNGICYVNCSVDQSNKIINIVRDPVCTDGKSGRTSLVCPDFDVVCEKQMSTYVKFTFTTVGDESVHPSITTTSSNTKTSTSISPIAAASSQPKVVWFRSGQVLVFACGLYFYMKLFDIGRKR